MNILLGVSGGIAAYKAAELVRRLQDQGAAVRVVMTESAQAFITPLTLQALSGNSVHRDVLDENAEAAMGHIELARWADLVLVAPATANTLARIAHGLADDLLTTLCLATQAPLAVAPSMNQHMWNAKATQANLSALISRGVWVWGPDAGSQACGDVGPGRMLDPTELALRAVSASQTGPLSGRRILVTAGPTREAIDPVRFITNHSSGKMGYAVARAAHEMGGDVTVVSGPVAIEPPRGVAVVRVTSAAEMHAEVMQRAVQCDLFVAAAAVADYTPAHVASSKIKKKAADMHIDLARSADILADVAALPSAPFTVGFAAETDDLEANARGKLLRKKLKMIAANQVGNGHGFDVDHNTLNVFWHEGHQQLGPADKLAVARELMALVVTHLADDEHV
jgi:phosphopantothenoylcysteine decarboxylase / phosphopantothenate---cysteine ligase